MSEIDEGLGIAKLMASVHAPAFPPPPLVPPPSILAHDIQPNPSPPPARNIRKLVKRMPTPPPLHRLPPYLMAAPPPQSASPEPSVALASSFDYSVDLDSEDSRPSASESPSSLGGFIVPDSATEVCRNEHLCSKCDSDGNICVLDRRLSQPLLQSWAKVRPAECLCLKLHQMCRLLQPRHQRSLLPARWPKRPLRIRRAGTQPPPPWLKTRPRMPLRSEPLPHRRRLRPSQRALGHHQGFIWWRRPSPRNV